MHPPLNFHRAFATVLQPLPSERMEAHEVSTLVNSTENDTAACTEPVSSTRVGKQQLPLTGPQLLSLIVSNHTAQMPAFWREKPHTVILQTKTSALAKAVPISIGG